MSNFNPVKLGELEAGWWRAHGEGKKSKLFKLVIEAFSEQYGLSFLGKRAIAYVVKAGIHRGHREWEDAKREIIKFYSVIRKEAGLEFDPKTVATEEIGWWKLHDELEEQKDKTPLTEAFMNLYSEIYGVDRELLRNAAGQRTLATVEHDKAEEEGITPEEAGEHWESAKKHLIAFYTQLKEVIEANI